ncbi:DNA primase [Candidatus Poribacteria bacterium]
MAGRIPDNIIEEVKSRTDIVEVISEYVSLKPAGKAFKGLCPFHDDKNPSFTVNPDMQIYKCFACGEGGSVFRFLQKHEKMEFHEAVRFLAERCNVTISEATKADKERGAARDDLLKLNRAAVNYFHRILKDSAAGKQALTYLTERGIKDSIIDSFKLGFSLPGWDGFMKAAGKVGFSREIMFQGGFILQSQKNQNNYYDRFRGRVMFPIFDQRGEPIGFGGRILESSESDAKYINSPETPLYSKSRSLYNLNLAKEAIRKEGFVVLAEGYMDVIACFQAGVHNVIASLGTSLAEGQVRLIKRHADEVVIAYDSDSAGAAATSRGLNLLVKEGIKVRMLNLSSDKDPDDFIRENGAEAFQDLVAKAVDLVDYKVDKIQEEVSINSIEGKTRAVDDLVTTLTSFNTQLEKHEYVKKSAERLNMEEDYIWQQLEEKGAGKRVRRSTQPTIKSPKKKGGAREAIEQRLLECLIQHPEFITQARSQITREDFSNPGHAELAEALWTNNGGEGIDLGTLIDKCASDESQKIISSLILQKESPPNCEAVFLGCIKKMREFRGREFQRSVLKEGSEDNLAMARRLMELRQQTKSTT